DSPLSGDDPDQGAAGAVARDRDDPGGSGFDGVSGVLCDVPCDAGAGRDGDHEVSPESAAAGLLGHSNFTHAAGGGGGAAGNCDADAGGAAAVGSASADRVADVLDLALRVGYGGDRVL